MHRSVAGLALAALMTCGLTSAASAEDKVFTIENVQTSVPAGATLVVKKITVGDDATVINLVVSFDSRDTNRVNLNDSNAYLAIGEGQQLKMRALKDNPYLTIMNGQSLEGDIVFPGRIPADAKSVKLVFNDGNAGDDNSAPGVSLTIPLPGRD